jgi:hypothetical protein
MTNWNVPTNKTCCDAGEEEGFPRAHVDVVSITVFSLVVFALCALIVVFVRLRENLALQAQLEEDVALHDRKREKTRTRKESISNGLIVKEWVPDDASVVESPEKDQDTSPGEAVAASQPLAPPINTSSPASCVMGSDDCESLAGEEEMAGCAICLSHFKPQQLVCESNNSSCQHAFHKHCMVDWLMKHNANTCPMCREVYILHTTV